MSRFGKLLRATAAAALTAVGTTPAAAQQPAAAPTPLPEVGDFLNRGRVAPASGFGRSAKSACGPTCGPACAPGCPTPCTPAPYYPGSGMPPSAVPPTAVPPTPGTPSPLTDSTVAADTAPDFGGRERGAGAGPTVGLNGYIDNAAPISMLRLRWDAGYGNNRPDRAEFFYAKCGCFGTPDAKGPPLPERNVDYQDVISTAEFAFNCRFSVFADVPVRFLNPEANMNTAGLGDVSWGMKYAFVYNQRRIVSFLLRSISPTGDRSSGLGTGNWWLEPGILWLEQMNPKWQVFGELRDQIPLDRQSDFTGNVMRYGLGTSYMVASGDWGYIAPVVEAVGWTVLSGKEAGPISVVSSAGSTIANAKFGVRIGLGSVAPGTPYPTRSDLYIGYGRAMTGAVWYKNLMRVEYRWFF